MRVVDEPGLGISLVRGAQRVMCSVQPGRGAAI